MLQGKNLFIAAVIFALFGAGATASGEKELIIRLQGEVLVLQRQMRDLQESLDKWQGQASGALQKISDDSSSAARQIATIEEALKTQQSSQVNGMAGANSQLRKLVEQMNENNRNLTRLAQQMDKMGLSLEEFKQKSEERERTAGTADPAGFASNPAGAYAQGYQYFSRGDYESAINSFNAFLSLQPQSEESDDAIFWIGESRYRQGRYADALREYDRIMRDFPGSDRLSSALYKKGMTLLSMERRDEGVTTLNSVVTRFPDSAEARLARNELGRLGY